MGRCFVIQPFDGGKFDKRFDDIYVPAIDAAGLAPYRVDRDHGVTIPIEDIQMGIESSRVCLADITLDNPNVWFELGYAIASQRDVVLVCSDERTSRFPFDVQHRSIIKYSTDSPRDFDKLRDSISMRLKAILEKSGSLDEIARMPTVTTIQGLEQYEFAALVAVAQQIPEPYGGVSNYMIRQDLETAGFNALAANLAVRGLIAKQMLDQSEEREYDGAPFFSYRVTERGMSWLLSNTDKLRLKAEPRQPPNVDDNPF